MFVVSTQKNWNNSCFSPNELAFRQHTYRMNAGNFPSQCRPSGELQRTARMSQRQRGELEISQVSTTWATERSDNDQDTGTKKRQTYKSPRQHASGAVIRLRLLSIFSNSMYLITVNKLLSCTVYFMSSRTQIDKALHELAIRPKHVHKCVYQNIESIQFMKCMFAQNSH